MTEKKLIVVGHRPLKLGVFYSSGAPLGLDSSGGGSYEASLASLLAELRDDLGIELLNFIPRSALKSAGRPKELNGDPVFGYHMNLAEKLLGLFPSPGLEKVMAASEVWGLQKTLLRKQVHLAYFASPNGASLVLKDIPFFGTVWDLGHRDLPGFPEVWSQAEWSLRESLYSRSVPRASFTFVDSISTGEKLEHLYGLKPSRWSAIGLLENPTQPESFARELPFPYLIYPAMKWPHKNHITLLKAFSLILDKKPELKLVLTGGDAGNERYIHQICSNLGVSNSVIDLGFVKRARLQRLIFHAEALVMPSLLGPTNLPPLEALQLGTRAVVSSHHDFGRDDLVGLSTAEALNPEAWEAEILRTLERSKEFARPASTASFSKQNIANALFQIAQELECISPR